MLSAATMTSMVSNGRMTQQKANEVINAQQLEVKEQVIRGQFDRDLNNESIPEAQRFQNAYSKLDDMAGKVPKGWTPDEWDRFISSQQGI